MKTYRDLATELRKDIRSGKFDKKGKLPSHPEISETYGIGMMSVQRALNLLREENLIYTNHAGTFLGSRLDAASGRDVWLVKCHDCMITFEASGPFTYEGFRDAIHQVGWAIRGSGRGWDYYCPAHTPWGD